MMLSTIQPPFKPEPLYELDRAACMGMMYGSSLSNVLKALDPDLHNPISAELLLMHEEQREIREKQNRHIFATRM